MNRRFLTLGFVLAISLCSMLYGEEPIRHKMLLNDESRQQLLYVDPFEPKNDWALPFGEITRDMQLVGRNRVMVALTVSGGFREYDLETKKVVLEVTDKKYAKAMTAVRFPDGRTLIGCDQEMVRLFLFNSNGTELKKLEFPGLKTIRLMRRTARNTFLFGSNSDKVCEVDLDGKIIRTVQLPEAKHIFQAIELPGGNVFAASGYGGCLAEIDKEGKIVRKFGGLPAPEGLLYHFMSQFQPLKGGGLVVATWTGHGAHDSDKGQQLVEFDATGKVVWKWHDPKRAGSIHGVIILDDLNPEQFYDDLKFVDETKF